jgi:hypothetical protein
MRDFVQKQNRPQKAAASSPSLSNMAVSHRPSGHQIVQQWPQTGAEELGARLNNAASTRFAHDFSRIPAHGQTSADNKTKFNRTYAGEFGASPGTGGAGRTRHPLLGTVASSFGTSQEVPHRARMEAAFGANFSSVRAYSGSRSALDTLDAEAATAGEDVAFATARPGLKLVAHELAHVLQQRRGVVPRDSSQGVLYSPSLEAEADVAAQAAVAGRPVPSLFRTGAPPTASPGAIQLQKKEKTPSPILYIGVTGNAPAEAEKLTGLNKDRGGVKVITTTDPQDVLEDKGVKFDLRSDDGKKVFAQSLGLAPEAEEKVIGLLMGAGENSLDELAAIIKFYAAAEADPGTPRMKRVVLSGHGGGSGIVGQSSNDASTEIWSGVSFASLVKLAEIYPKAAGQVEHLHVSACHEGGEITMEKYYLKAFPNVRTIWGYAGVCPSKGRALSAMETWEAATEEPGVKNLPKQAGVATWGEGGYQGKESALEEVLARLDELQSVFEGYFNGTKTDSNPEAGELTDYYRMLSRVVGRPGLEDAERERLSDQKQVALRLRFYLNVRKHFMSVHGKTIQEGYDAIKLTMPNYATLSRKDALKAIKDFALAAGSNAPAAKALELLENGLQNLNPKMIPYGWIF